MSSIEELGLILSQRKHGYIQAVEQCLGQLCTSVDENILLGLFSLFDDSAEDEVMFLIIHTVESVDDDLYCKCLFESVESLWSHSPRWTQILHIRVMNSLTTLSVYLKLYKHAPQSQCRVVDEIYSSIESGWPNIAAKARAVRDAMTK